VGLKTYLILQKSKLFERNSIYGHARGSCCYGGVPVGVGWHPGPVPEKPRVPEIRKAFPEFLNPTKLQKRMRNPTKPVLCEPCQASGPWHTSLMPALKETIMVNATRKPRKRAPKKTAFAESLTAALTASKAVEERLHSNLITDYGLKGNAFIAARTAVYEAWKEDKVRPEDIPETMSLSNTVCRFIFDALADAITPESDREIAKATTQEMKAKKFTPAMKAIRENKIRTCRNQYEALVGGYKLFLKPATADSGTGTGSRGRTGSSFSDPERFYAMCWHASEKLKGDGADQAAIDFSNAIKAACKTYAEKVTALKTLSSRLSTKKVVVKASLAKAK